MEKSIALWRNGIALWRNEIALWRKKRRSKSHFGEKNGEINRALAKNWRRNGEEMATYYGLNI
jgi:hypothetical protein